MKRILIGLAFAATMAGCAISTQQEVQMGTDYAQQINAQLPIVKDPEVVRYINVLGDSIAKLADDRSLDWQFFVVNSQEVNAFAVPGGYVYVNRGLIERAQRWTSWPVCSAMRSVTWCVATRSSRWSRRRAPTSALRSRACSRRSVTTRRPAR
jgi:predicted Zn-dependent protease